MKTSDIRQAFIDFFQRNGHTRVASSSLVPANDPTLIFTNAGMNQFKECFLGAEKRAYTRAVTCQKCIRVSGKHNDLENVGVTARHHTFFEMLGNFSFGDYFKPDAIKFGWEFVTKVLKIPEERLWVTIFEKDDEAGELWRSLTTIRPERIVRLGEADNFWAMGDTGPCGPCSEIHYFRGENLADQTVELFKRDDGSFVEIWNLVFMQFNRSADGTMAPLPKPSVDTGMGLERVTAILQNVPANYDTDLLRGIITVCEQLSGLKYDGRSYVARDLRADKQYATDVAMRVIADHSRAIAFAIADGVLPSSEGRGYVLRRIIRRAVRHGKVIGLKAFLTLTCKEVIKLMGEHYRELREREDTIEKIVEAEERKFHETLDSGLAVLQREVEKLKKGELFPGKTAFLLHDTYGFPLDLTEDALKPFGLKVDRETFDREMESQRQRSREDRKAQGLAFSAITVQGPKTKFLGYETLQAESKLTNAIRREKDSFSLVFEETPFYGESGGQVGDTGTIRFKDAALEVIDTQKVQDGYFVHECTLKEGVFSEGMVGERGTLQVDDLRRSRIRAHHSATHLLHAGLRRILGKHVKQAGSKVDDRELRFDYSHFEPVSDGALREIQAFVNEEVRANREVVTREMGREEAEKLGAMALFGEKYGDRVRVIEMGPYSIELCGGTHVKRTGDIGVAMVASDSGIAAGVRRIECWAGQAAYEQLVAQRQELANIAGLLKSDSHNVLDKVEKLVMRTKQLERELEGVKGKLASSATGDLTKSARTGAKGVKFIAEKVETTDPETLRSMVDKLRLSIGSGVVALAASDGERGVLVAGITPDLKGHFDAGRLVKEAALVSGGRGGGRPDFAQAGGLDPSKLNASLEKIVELIG